MNVIEQVATRLRHLAGLNEASWLWYRVRPLYDKSVSLIGRHGLERNMNGSDRMLILPKFRNIPELYEPETWALLRAELQPGDSVADVGAYIGLYTVAIAQLVGASGRVYAFEPNTANCEDVRAHLRLNQVENRVELAQAALGDEDGKVSFDGSLGISGHVAKSDTPQAEFVPCIRLDTFLAGRSVDVLKIDVEGYEEFVLRGASKLLNSPERKPRTMFIEVHPYAWQNLGVSGQTLLELLADCGYEVRTLEGNKVESIDRYGEIIARRIHAVA